MRPISGQVIELFKAHKKQTAKISVTTKSGNSFVLTEADILTNGFKLNRSSVSGETVELGSVIASELELVLNNYNERLHDVAFEGAKLFVLIYVTDGSAKHPVDFGYFTVDEVLKGKNTITITALDSMVNFDKEIKADFFTDITDTITVSELVKKICHICGIVIKTDLSTLPNYNYTVVSVPQTSGLTYRQILSWCCQIMGVCAYIDSDDSLVLKWYCESGFELGICDRYDRYDSVIGENLIVLNRLMITVAEKTYLSGTGDYAINLTGNMLVQTNPQEMLDNLYSVIGGLTYIPFTAETIPLPQLEPLDKIKIIDKSGKTYPTIITNWTFSLNNFTALAGQGISETKNNYAATAPFTPAQTFVIERNNETIKTAIDTKITQTRESILFEVSGTYATNEAVNTALQLTSEGITSEVNRAKEAEKNLSSRIEQNANAIKLKVSKDDLTSEIEQKADAIRLKASKIAWTSDKSSMTEEGVLTATGANITGQITATSLILNGCKISSSDIDGLPTMPDMTLYIKVGATGKIGEGTFKEDGAENAAFQVDADGLLQAKNAVIYGTIYASAGKVGGFNTDNASLFYKNSLDKHLFYLSPTSATTIATNYFDTLKTKFFLQYGNTASGFVTSTSTSDNEDLLFIGGKVYIGGRIDCGVIDGSKFIGAVYTTESGKSLQDQINGKASSGHNHDSSYAKLSGATFTGTVKANYYRAGDAYVEATRGATISDAGNACFGQTVICKILTQKSDRRLKNTIAELDHSFDEFFRKLKPVTFKFNDKKEFSFGFIAQDVQKALAESGHDTEQFDIVQKGKDVYYSINHAQITALNTHMIQIALNENAELKKRISQLEEEILKLTA